MNTIKKIVLANFIVVLGVFGIWKALPVVAEEITKVQVNNSFKGALDSFRVTRKQVQELKEKTRVVNNLEKRKVYTERIINVLLQRSENVKNRVIGNKVIYGDLESSIIAEVKADITELNELKNRVNTVKTASELKNLAQELQSHRKDLGQMKIRRLTLLSHIGSFEKTILKSAEIRSAKIAEKLVELKNSGKNVSDLESLLLNANAKIASASNKLVKLKADVNKQGLSETKLTEIQAVFNSIKGDIKVAYEIFLQIAIQGKKI